MIRKLLATTAFATLLATGAYAQETAPATTTTEPAMGTTAPAATDGAMPATDGAAMTNAAAGNLATNMIGENVYNGTAENAERIGEVNDLVLSDAGQIESVIVGVGGFLGIGEKNVALNFSDLQWNQRDGDRWLVTSATKESLEALPTFDRSAYQPAATTAMNNTATGGNTMATTDAAAPAATDPAVTTTAPAATTAPAGSVATDTTAAPMATDTTQTAAIDRSTLTAVAPDMLTSENLTGTTVYGANEENVGSISDVVLTPDGKVDAVLLDVGGFLGIGAKTVAVGMDSLQFMQDGNNNRYLYTNFTREQLEAQPAYDAGTYSTQRDQQRIVVQ